MRADIKSIVLAGWLGLGTFLGAAPAAKPPDSAAASAIEPGKTWLDVDGQPIQAHGGGLLLARTGTYYWYGEDKSQGDRNRVGITCYSSKDLYHWKREGLALPKENVPEEFRDEGICERPKVIFSSEVRKYVMWVHLDRKDYTAAEAGVAVSDTPTGPFVLLSHKRPISLGAGFPANDRLRQNELGGTFRDFNLFVDDDGTAYVFYA